MNKKQKLYGRPIFGGRIIGLVIFIIMVMILNHHGINPTGEPNESGLGILLGFSIAVSLITGKLRIG